MEFKLKHLGLIGGIISLIFSLGFIFMPETLLPMLGIEGNVLGFRVFGTAVLGNAVLQLMMRNSDKNLARTAILSYEVVVFLLINVMMFIYLDLTNFMVWATILLHFVFVFAYAYFLVKKE